MKVAGVYQIKNLVNGLIYIGSSVNIYGRWWSHKSMLRRRIHKNPYLQNSWNKYGEENFEFKILEIVENLDDVLLKEQEYLNTHLPDYNICKYVDATTAGIPKSDEHKKKISESKKGTKTGKDNYFYGKHHTDESKIKMSEIAKSRIHSDETKRKIGNAQIGEKSHYAKLTWDIVNEIRVKFESGKYTEAELVRMYNMSQSAINKLLRYKT
jgi:group I intron endonuclease